ncbi:MAG: hypothetical protein AAGJ79_03765 [Verrucomicrobiota bacterium]
MFSVVSSGAPILADWTLNVDWITVILSLLGIGAAVIFILATPLLLVLCSRLRTGNTLGFEEGHFRRQESNTRDGVRLSALAREAPRISPEVPEMPTRPTSGPLNSGSPVESASPGKTAKKKAAPKPKKKAAPKTAKSSATRPAANDAAASPKKKATAPKGAKIDPTLGLVYKKKPKEVDDLQEISGVGPVLEKKLHKVGIYTFAQVAKWSDKMVREFSEKLSFRDRIRRDNWRKQAAKLHKKKYGKSATR